MNERTSQPQKGTGAFPSASLLDAPSSPAGGALSEAPAIHHRISLNLQPAPDAGPDEVLPVGLLEQPASQVARAVTGSHFLHIHVLEPFDDAGDICLRRAAQVKSAQDEVNLLADQLSGVLHDAHHARVGAPSDDYHATRRLDHQ